MEGSRAPFDEWASKCMHGQQNLLIMQSMSNSYLYIQLNNTPPNNWRLKIKVCRFELAYLTHGPHLTHGPYSVTLESSHLVALDFSEVGLLSPVRIWFGKKKTSPKWTSIKLKCALCNGNKHLIVSKNTRRKKSKSYLKYGKCRTETQKWFALDNISSYFSKSVTVYFFKVQ